MDRRLASVIGLSLLFALVVAGVFYQMVAGSRRAVFPPKLETREVVVAVRTLPVGITIKPDDVKLASFPASQVPEGAFLRVEDLIERPVLSTILPGEPVREGRLAARGAGLGLAPVIPDGMRAVSVRVNDVVGVAGFVLPGVRVDVLVTGSPPGNGDTMTTTVLQNILVLSAGQHIEPEARGQAINAPVVTLLVTPAQAETLTLAGSEGRIQLVLRNSGDHVIEKTQGRMLAELYGRKKPSPPVRRTPSPKPPIPTAPPAPLPRDEVVVIRGTKRTVEVVGAQHLDAVEERR